MKISMPKVFNTLATIGLGFSLMIGAGFGNIGAKVIGEAFFWPSTHDKLINAANEINARLKLPIMLDSVTRMDKVTAGTGRVLVSDYTLVKHAATQLSAQQLSAIQNRVVRRSCAQQQQNLLSKNTAMRFRYTSADGYVVQDFTISPGDCGNASAQQPATDREAHLVPFTGKLDGEEELSTLASTPVVVQPRVDTQVAEHCEIKQAMTDHEIEVCRRRK